MSQSLFDGSHVGFIAAFLAGLVTFFASCLVPLVPTYLAYLSGIAVTDASDQVKRWHMLQISVSFVAGFILTFMLLGLTTTKLYALLAPNRLLLEFFAGAFFVGLGMFMLGVFKHRIFSQERRVSVHGLFTKNQYLHAFLAGVAFSIGWTPCIGPVLAVILYSAAKSATALRGGLLLMTYGLGLGLPFIVVALGFEKISPLLRKHRAIALWTSRLAAAFVIGTGMLLMLGQRQVLSLVILKFMQLHPLAF